MPSSTRSPQRPSVSRSTARCSCDVVEDAEVDEREPARRAALDLRDRLLPGLEVELGRRAGRHRRSDRPRSGRRPRPPRRASRPPSRYETWCHAWPGRREALEPNDAVADDVHVLRRNRRELAPELVERVAVEPARARLELRRVDEVRRADLGDVNLEPRVLAHEHARGARVVEVDVREEQVPDVGEVEPALGEAGLQVRDGGGRAAVEERRAVLRLEQVAADDARRLVVEVDRLDGARGDLTSDVRSWPLSVSARLDDLLEPGEHLLPVRLRVLGGFGGRVVVLAQCHVRHRRRGPRART